MSPYAASKLAAEAYALAYQSSYGLPVLTFRFFNVFGPLQAADHAYAAVVPLFAAAALAGRPLIVQGDGRQTRDFTYVGTVAALITDAIARRVTYPEPVNLAFGTRTEILELARMVEELVGTPTRDRAHGSPGRRRAALTERSDPTPGALPRRRPRRPPRLAPRHPRLVPRRSMTLL